MQVSGYQHTSIKNVLQSADGGAAVRTAEQQQHQPALDFGDRGEAGQGHLGRSVSLAGNRQSVSQNEDRDMGLCVISLTAHSGLNLKSSLRTLDGPSLLFC